MNISIWIFAYRNKRVCKYANIYKHIYINKFLSLYVNK